MVQNALENLAREDELEAIEKIEQPSHAREFRKALEEVEKERKEKQPKAHSEGVKDNTPEPQRELTLEKKKEIAEKIQQRLTEEKQAKKPFQKSPTPQHFRSTKDKIKSMVREELNGESEFEAAQRMLEYDLGTIHVKAKDMSSKIVAFNTRLNDMDVQKIGQLKNLEMATDLIGLVKNIRSLMEKLEITF